MGNRNKRWTPEDIARLTGVKTSGYAHRERTPVPPSVLDDDLTPEEVAELDAVSPHGDTSVLDMGSDVTTMLNGRGCKHRMTPVASCPTLVGSSVRGGVAVPGNSVTVLLTSEDLPYAIPAGWATWRSRYFNSHLRGALVYWPWRDMTTPELTGQTLGRLIELHQLHRSGKLIEVACFGGHGRTGTLLAILAALAKGWHHDKAVKLLRQGYCDRAIETKGQEQFVSEAILAIRACFQAPDHVGQDTPGGKD